MKILIRQVLIAETDSPYNSAPTDILIENGIIQAIQKNIDVKADQVIEADGLYVSAGWVDCFAQVPDPGFEFKETLESASLAAAAGGFTKLFALPNNNPVTDVKSSVEYIVRSSKTLPADILPLGAVSKGTSGKELAEMYDMHASGAVAFSDGLYPIQSAGLLLKALQYVKAFNGTVIQVPVDKSINANGLMHEGIISTSLGMPGLPEIAEELIIQRDIELLEYTQSRLHITGVTSQKSITLIKQAKEKGLQVTCSVSPFHLLYCDEDLKEYDTNYKFFPPLRTKEDMLQLRRSVLNGDIDMIASHHQPQDIDGKQCEFEYAKPGQISLQTVFHLLLKAIPEITESQIAMLLSGNVRKAFNLKTTIEKGSKAELSFFTKKGTTAFSSQTNKSRSANSSVLNTELPGKVVGIFNKGQLYLN